MCNGITPEVHSDPVKLGGGRPKGVRSHSRRGMDGLCQATSEAKRNFSSSNFLLILIKRGCGGSICIGLGIPVVSPEGPPSPIFDPISISLGRFTRRPLHRMPSFSTKVLTLSNPVSVGNVWFAVSMSADATSSDTLISF
jgi:hypothetical protein